MLVQNDHAMVGLPVYHVTNYHLVTLVGLTQLYHQSYLLGTGNNSMCLLINVSIGLDCAVFYVPDNTV